MLRRTPHQIALQTILGDPGVAGLSLVALATGLGLLLDFWVTNLHPIFSITLMLLSVPLSAWWTLRRTRLRMDRKPNPDYVRNLALATVAGQAGCGSVILIFLMLFAGMYLDARLDTHPVFTLGLVLAAIPVSLYSMVRLVLSATAAIQHTSPEANKENGS